MKKKKNSTNAKEKEATLRQEVMMGLVKKVNCDKAGERVYYRRDDDKAAWRGPTTILTNRGSAGYFLEHQGNAVRVAACRLVAIGEAKEQIGSSRLSPPRIPWWSWRPRR